MDRTREIGQHLVTGFQGPEMSDAFIQSVREYKIGNVILFENNVTDKLQLKRLCEEIDALVREETGIAPFITIDQEGGVVSRLKDDATVFPSAMAVAASGNPQNASVAGRITAEELRAMGVNFDLAPVMDINSNPKNPVIGVRSYGDQPSKVAEYGTAMMKGLEQGGILSCLKHFPGHGDTSVDSHLGLPRVDKGLNELLACELIPFQAAINAGAPAVMSTHILFPQIEPDNVPATMSRRILTDLLRKQMGFQGLILSDCMMMGAIAQFYGTVAGSMAAVHAGIDLVFVSHDAALASQVSENIAHALRQGTLDEKEFAASTERILSSKAKLNIARPSMEIVGCAEHRAASLQITREAITLVRDAPFRLGDTPLFLGCNRFRPNLASNPEEGDLSFTNTLQTLLGGNAVTTPQDPDDGAIEAALSRVSGHTSIVIGLYNALSRSGQLKLVKAAAQKGLPICAVALRNPYDLADLPHSVRTIAAYDYDRRTLPILAKMLQGDLPISGKLPVRLEQTL